MVGPPEFAHVLCANIVDFYRFSMRADEFDDDQLFVMFVFANGGRDVEHAEFNNFREVCVSHICKDNLFAMRHNHEDLVPLHMLTMAQTSGRY